jgi:hypothetical protein
MPIPVPTMIPMMAPKNRQDHRFGPDHRADLTAFHADRPQQADLAGALEHREHEGIHDPDERDEHG